ncbi:MAG: SDR family oxidoreductase [Bacteroidetes bacterium]|nr:MAG: SDR family oxidoreductase [Bacteroidota bacterium]
MNPFQDKVVVITGSSQGIGKYLALELAKHGSRIVLNGRDPKRLEKAVALLAGHSSQKPLVVQGDVSNWEDNQRLIRETLDHFGRIDIVIANAGVGMTGPIETSDPHAMKKVMDINFTGCLFTCRAAIEPLKASKGSLLITGSIAGFHGLPTSGVYSCSKMALTALAQTLRIELADTGIHVGLAYVGMTDTEPEKMVINHDGTVVPRPDYTLHTVPIEKAVLQMVDMLRTRRKVEVFTLLGKLNALLSRISPGLIEYILTRNYRKQLKARAMKTD